jgi:hypothetical protein
MTDEIAEWSNTPAHLVDLPNEPNAGMARRPSVPSTGPWHLYHPKSGGEFEAQNERQARRMVQGLGWRMVPASLVPATQGAQRKAERDRADPWRAGFDRSIAGGSIADCPHADGTWDHHAWMLGFARFPRDQVAVRPAQRRRWGRPTKGTGAR